MSMAKSSQPTLQGIQILRGLAALAVVLHHTMEESLAARVGSVPPNWLITAGAAGVDVFFVISGFIMLHVAFPKAGAPPSPGRFLWRRALRIYPIYWCCCAVVVALGALGFYANKSFSAASIFISLLLLPTAEPLVHVSWTLVHEVLFYIIFAATLLLRNRIASLVLCSLALLSLWIIGQSLPAGALRAILGNPVALEFCFGMTLAWLYEHRGYQAPLAWWWALPAMAVIMIAPAFVPHTGTNGLSEFTRVMAWGVPATIMVASALAIGPRLPWVGQILMWLGDTSYALYLTHIFVMVSYAKVLKTTLLGDVPQWFVMPVIVVLAVAGGALAHLLVERRLMSRPAMTPERKCRTDPSPPLQNSRT